MRTLHHLVAIAALTLFVVAIRTVVPAAVADADVYVIQSPTLNVLQMQAKYAGLQSLPVQRIHDMTFIFGEAD